MKLPTEAGEYLFYFRNNGDPFYSVERVSTDLEGDPYIVNSRAEEPAHWWHLPQPNKYPDGLEGEQ